jgi:7-carboxy-7-deazaguanine synthase
VVVTGGEPMIAPGVETLTTLLQQAGLHVTVETAGTVYSPVKADLMSISPKLANSTPVAREAGRWAAQHERLRYQPDVLKALIAGYNYQLKFVIAQPPDVAEVQQIVSSLNAEPERVILMPEGTDPGKLRERANWLVEECKRQHWRFSPRLHIDIWGDRRGV